MPEEINRVLTNRVSTLCCCPSNVARLNLAAEGITNGVQIVGDVMLDALTDTAERVRNEAWRLDALGVRPHEYVLATVHRAANTDNTSRLRAIVSAFGALSEVVRWPMHPRTRQVLTRESIALTANVQICDRLGYLDVVCALSHARAAVTDSGGLQKEAYWLGTGGLWGDWCGEAGRPRDGVGARRLIGSRNGNSDSMCTHLPRRFCPRRGAAK